MTFRSDWAVFPFDDSFTLPVPPMSLEAVNKSDGTSLLVTKDALWALMHEYPFWLREYIPSFDISGKTILDIGAGCGESAYLYFKKGASKVVCIEQDHRAVDNLRRNARINKWNCEILVKRFETSDLRIDCDLVKMDIEGSERLLFMLDKLPPMILESHTKKIASDLISRFPDLKIKSEHPIYETKILSNCG